MFKSKLTILTQDWVEIESYRSKFKPNVGEYIYSSNLGTYLKVISIIHNIGLFTTTTIVVVEEVGKELGLI